MPKVDLSIYQGREQAYVKHCLLEEYLPDWAYKVGTTWDSLVYIDGFAGPWETKHPDYADSSFGIAIDLLRRCQVGLSDARGRHLPMESILVEQSKTAFANLKRFAASRTRAGFGVHALCGSFVNNIPAINELIRKTTKRPFRFIFLDPKGWADIPMQKLQPFLQDRSCEVLINVMTRHINRFLEQDDRAGSYHSLFGRDEVLKTLLDTPSDERVDQAVHEYGQSLRLLCNFKYVSSAVILEPEEEAIRYFLVYATHHPRGVEVFKAAEIKAARIQEDIRHETHIRKTRQPGFHFDDAPPISSFTLKLHQRYANRARNKVVRVLAANTSPVGIRYADLFCEAMAFPLVRPDDLQEWLRELGPTIKIELAGSARRRKPSPLKEDRVIVVNPQGLH